MDDANLRPAAVADLPMILAGERDYMRTIEPEQLATWTEAIDRNLALWINILDQGLVAERDGTPAGYSMWQISGDDSRTATLVTIYVLPPQRKHGIGRLLLDGFERGGQAAGASTFALGVHQANPARRLYESAGYARIGQDGDYLLYERSGSVEG